LTVFFRGHEQVEVPQARIFEVDMVYVTLYDANGTEVCRAEIDQVVKLRWRQAAADGRLERFVNLEVLNA